VVGIKGHARLGNVGDRDQHRLIVFLGELEPLADKWRSFRWDVVEIDGHDMAQVVAALERAPEAGRPRAIIAHTVKGKGVPCLENTPRAHYSRLTPEEAAEALGALEVAS